MMLEDADQHLVAGFEERRPPALSHEVDRLGGVAHEDDLARIGGIEKTPHLFAGFFEQLGRAGAQTVHSAVHIGVVRAVVVGDAIDHRARLLGAGARVEKHQIGIVSKNRKLTSEHPRVEPPRCGEGAPQSCRCHPHSSKIAKRRASRDSKCSRISVESTSSTVSRTKASINIRRASRFGMPRVRR